MRISRFAGAIVAAASLGLIVTAGTAAAEPPGEAFEITLPADGGWCDFPVTITGTSNSQQRGPYVFAGRGFATVTNDYTGESLRLNISGPGKYTVEPDGGFSVDASGPNLFYTTFENSFPGVPQLAYTTGHVQFTVDATGLTTAYKLSGRSTDLCAALK